MHTRHSRLTASQVVEGHVLACTTHVTGDVVVRVPPGVAPWSRSLASALGPRRQPSACLPTRRLRRLPDSVRRSSVSKLHVTVVRARPRQQRERPDACVAGAAPRAPPQGRRCDTGGDARASDRDARRQLVGHGNRQRAADRRAARHRLPGRRYDGTPVRGGGRRRHDDGGGRDHRPRVARDGRPSYRVQRSGRSRRGHHRAHHRLDPPRRRRGAAVTRRRHDLAARDWTARRRRASRSTT